MNLLDICKQIYNNTYCDSHKVEINFHSITKLDDLNECIWTIFLYGLDYFEKNQYPTDIISLNINNITEKNFNKVQQYMKSIGINITLYIVDKQHIKDDVKHIIKMYNYEFDKNIKIEFTNNGPNVDMKISNMLSYKDKKNINEILKKINNIEYLIDIIPNSVPSISYDFHRKIAYQEIIYIVYFEFGYN